MVGFGGKSFDWTSSHRESSHRVEAGHFCDSMALFVGQERSRCNRHFCCAWAHVFRSWQYHVQKAGQFDLRSSRGSHLPARGVAGGEGVAGDQESSLGVDEYFVCVGSTLSTKYSTKEKTSSLPLRVWLYVCHCMIFWVSSQSLVSERHTTLGWYACDRPCRESFFELQTLICLFWFPHLSQMCENVFQYQNPREEVGFGFDTL